MHAWFSIIYLIAISFSPTFRNRPFLDYLVFISLDSSFNLPVCALTLIWSHVVLALLFAKWSPLTMQLHWIECFFLLSRWFASFSWNLSKSFEEKLVSGTQHKKDTLHFQVLSHITTLRKAESKKEGWQSNKIISKKFLARVLWNVFFIFYFFIWDLGFIFFLHSPFSKCLLALHRQGKCCDTRWHTVLANCDNIWHCDKDV